MINTPRLKYFDRIVLEYAVPRRVVRHNLIVAATCATLSNENSLSMSLGYFHDIFKVASLSFRSFLRNPNVKGKIMIPTLREFLNWWYLHEKYKGHHEVEVAARIIGKEYPEFAAILREVGSTNNPSYLKSKKPEVKIAHYADWRVQSDVVINLLERLAYLESYYFHGKPEEWGERKKIELELEEQIFSGLDFKPSELSDYVNKYLDVNPDIADRL